jgi:hypothetical protein
MNCFLALASYYIDLDHITPAINNLVFLFMPENLETIIRFIAKLKEKNQTPAQSGQADTVVKLFLKIRSKPAPIKQSTAPISQSYRSSSELSSVNQASGSYLLLAEYLKQLTTCFISSAWANCYKGSVPTGRGYLLVLVFSINMASLRDCKAH